MNLLGAVGWEGVPDQLSLWGLLIPIRREFEQHVNLRPIDVMEGVRTPLAHAVPAGTEGGVDLVIVRENTEGEYSHKPEREAARINTTETATHR